MRGPASAAAQRGRARALTTPGGLYLTAVLLLCAVPVTAPIRDPDFWWHLRTGQLILDRGGLLGTDPFTYTAGGHHWVMHEWLTEVLFAWMHSVGGVGLVVVVLSAVTMAGIVCLALRACLPRPDDGIGGLAGTRAGPVAVGTGLLLAVIAGYPIWGPRAQMETFALTCLTLLLVERHLRRGGRAIWSLVPVFVVWSNLHSGFTIGAGFMAVVLVAEVAAGRLGLRGTASPAAVRTVGLVLLACLAVVLINPNGPQIYVYAFETQFSSAQQELIQEWHSPDFHETVVRAFELMLLVLAALVVWSRRVRPRDAALALLTTAMALQSVRHVALFIAATTPLLVDQIDMAGRAVRQRLSARLSRPPVPSGRRGRTAEAGGSRPGAPRRTTPPVWFSAALLVLCTGVPAVVAVGRITAAASTREDTAFYASDYPVCAARWLAAAPTGLRVFNQYGEGGYLALHLTPRGDRVFIFGDAALMGDPLLLRYGRVEAVGPSWSDVITGSGTDVVVFDTGTPLATVLDASPRWLRVYRDAHNEAWVPRTAAGDSLRRRLPGADASRGGDGVCSAARTYAVGAVP